MEGTPCSGRCCRSAEASRCQTASDQRMDSARARVAPGHAARGVRAPPWPSRADCAHDARMKALLVRFAKDEGVCGGLGGRAGQGR